MRAKPFAFTTTLALAAVALFSPSAFALKGSISFSEADQRAHERALPAIMDTATACLQSDLDAHARFFAKWGVSPFYGDQSSYAKSTPDNRRAYLKRLRFDDEQISYLMKTLQPTSCIGITMKCLNQGFAAGGQAQAWAKIKAYVDFNGVTGAALQEALQQLGWKTLYWNPDVSRNAEWDAQERRLYPTNPRNIWGNHEAHWKAVNRSRKYLYNRVDDITTLVNFGEQTPRAILDVPFFVGVAHVGYHVFPGSYGQIIEGHSTRQLNDRQTIESSPFNPLADGGGPRGQYFSGLIAVPPGYVR